jgi:hypothetical protein
MPGPLLNAASVAAFLRDSDDEVYAPLVGLNVTTRHDEGQVTHRAVI